jgi:hypothetical protein
MLRGDILIPMAFAINRFMERLNVCEAKALR